MTDQLAQMLGGMPGGFVVAILGGNLFFLYKIFARLTAFEAEQSHLDRQAQIAQAEINKTALNRLADAIARHSGAIDALRLQQSELIQRLSDSEG